MPTEKLYWEDPFALEFDATCALVSTWEGRPSIVLPATRFYPEGGGQLGDTGTLTIGEARVAVSDTQVTTDGVIHHLVDGMPPADAGTVSVHGAVDRSRRLDHMAHHTAQHMLSSALVTVARAETVSARLGRTDCTIDLDVPGMGDRSLAAAEDLVNEVVRADVPIRALFPSAIELESLPLRRRPKVAEGVRVIDIEGLDLSPCGGTHCTRTGQIGLVRVRGVEKYKGKVRVSFHAADRALRDVRSATLALAAITRELTCGAADVAAALAKLQAELRTSREALAESRVELAERIGDDALAANPPRADGADVCIVVTRARDDVPALRALAGRLTGRGDVVALCFGDERDGELALVVQRGSGSTFDAGAWLKRVIGEHGGRGGGRPERAEGRLPREVVAALASSIPPSAGRG